MPIPNLNTEFSIFLYPIPAIPQSISMVDPVLTYISSSLNSPSAKHEGLTVLNLFLPQCSLEILEEKISQWIQATIRATTYRGAAHTVKLGFVVLKKLITRSQLIPEATKNVGNNHFAKIVDTLVNCPEQARLEALDCMAECMKVYAGPCGVHKGQFEAFLMGQIDASDENVVRSVGKCLLLLQQTRGGGTQGSLHKTAWAELQNKLLGSLHNCLDQLYANVTETYDAHTEDNFEALKLADLKLSSEPVTRVAQLYLRFTNLMKILEAVLM
jgi:rRNA processing/ribosome biogenesis